MNRILCKENRMYLFRTTSWRLTTTSLKSFGDYCAYEKPIMHLGYSQSIPTIRSGNNDANENSFVT